MDRPHVICEACFKLQADVWISEVWLYCEHFRVMARRRRATDKWTLDRDCPPDKARDHLAAAFAQMATYSAKKGQDFQRDLMMVQRVFVGNRDRYSISRRGTFPGDSAYGRSDPGTVAGSRQEDPGAGS